MCELRQSYRLDECIFVHAEGHFPLRNVLSGLRPARPKKINRIYSEIGVDFRSAFAPSDALFAHFYGGLAKYALERPSITDYELSYL